MAAFPQIAAHDILLALPGGVILADAQRRVSFVNPVAARLLAADADALLDRPVAELFAQLGIAVPAAGAETPIGLPWAVLYRVSAYQITLRSGATRHAGMLYLIAEQSPELRRSRDFTATLSHELRTPLTVVRGFAELLRQSAPLSPEENQELIAQLALRAGDMAGLVSDLSALASLESGTMRAQAQPTRIGELLSETIDWLGRQARGPVAEIVLPPDAEQIAAMADRDYLRHALHALLRQAICATPPDGRVTVQVARIGDTVQIEVQDGGEPLPAYALPRVFEPFGWSGSFSRRQHIRTGLELALARGFLSLNTGTIVVRSGKPHGNTYTVTLRAA